MALALAINPVALARTPRRQRTMGQACKTLRLRLSRFPNLIKDNRPMSDNNILDFEFKKLIRQTREDTEEMLSEASP
jgi:hypothetical protein